MGTTPGGIVYPDSTSNTQLWTHFQTMATGIDTMVRKPMVTLDLGTPSISHNTVSVLTPAGVIRNDHGMWTSGTDVSIPRDGLYRVGLVLRWASQATAAGFRQCRFNKNGTEQMQWNLPMTTVFNATNTIVWGEMPIELITTDIITFAGYQSSGASLSLVGASRAWVYCIEE